MISTKYSEVASVKQMAILRNFYVNDVMVVFILNQCVYVLLLKNRIFLCLGDFSGDFSVILK